ncbi:helix-turn-helix domain-containing protein [Paenibacillus donghaensis]|nr:helix-turn-helix domain-containing protein [Paenibacillus donghaensis]
MYNLAQHYHPITANPSQTNEVAPSALLQPYIRCFWGTGDVLRNASASEPSRPNPTVGPLERELIIPDTCMDIIWQLDEHTGNTTSMFSGVNDAPFEVPKEREPSGKTVFAIRFYFWAVHLFADDHLREVLNAHVDVRQYFSSFHRELGEQLARARSTAERIAAAETYLLRRMQPSRRTQDSLLNAVQLILSRKGLVMGEELRQGTGLGSRQLERLFREYTGLTPKKAADLVRFQHVWQELYYGSPTGGGLQDLVHAYGYSDQSHFNHNFRKYAGTSPLQALRDAGRGMSLFYNTAGSRSSYNELVAGCDRPNNTGNSREGNNT